MGPWREAKGGAGALNILSSCDLFTIDTCVVGCAACALELVGKTGFSSIEL
jgi:hypothetical protein